MRFTDLWEKVEDILLVEKYYQYTFPKNPETQMYDFYVLDYLNTVLSWESASFRDLPKDLEDSVKTAYTSLLPQLRTSLLDDVYYALCAEIRHAEDYKYANRALIENNPKQKALYKTYLQYMFYNQVSSEIADVFDISKPSSEVRVPEIEKDPNDSTVEKRNKSFKASHYAIKKTNSSREEFVEICNILFSQGQWATSYGGKNWGKIAKGWLLLNASDEIIPSGKEHQKAAKPSAEEIFNKANAQYKKEQERRAAKKGSITEAVDTSKGISKVAMSVAIDHVYDLQHNNDTVFNKLIAYKKEDDAGRGYAWIENTLDFRANLSSYFEMLAKASDAVKYMAPPVLYNKIGQTWEKDLKTITPAELDLNEYEAVDIKRPDDLKKNDYVVLKGAGSRSIAPNNTTVGSSYRVVMDYKGTNKLGRHQDNLLIIGDDGSPVGVRWDYFKRLQRKLPEDLQPKPTQQKSSSEGKIYTVDEINEMEQVDNVKNAGLAIGDWVVCRYKMGQSTTIGKAYQIVKFNTLQNQIAIEGDDGNEVYIASYRFSIPPDAQVLTNIPSAKSQSTINKTYTEEEISKWPDNPPNVLKTLKKGDIVVATTGFEPSITAGHPYTVLNIGYSMGSVMVVDDEGDQAWLDESWFKIPPASSMPPGTFTPKSSSAQQSSSEVTDKYDFKVGDVVEATENIETYNLTPGKLYTILHIPDHSFKTPQEMLDGEYIVELKDDEGHGVSMFAYRFKKAELMTPKASRDKKPYNFKEGDMVVFKEDYHLMTKGKAYKVKEVLASYTKDGTHSVRVIGDDGSLLGFYSYRFEPYPVKRPSQINAIKQSSQALLSPDNTKDYPFQVGDKVKCIDADGVADELSEGKTYTVVEVTKSPLSTQYHVSLQGFPGAFKAVRFEKVEEDAAAKPFDKKVKVGDMVECIDNSLYESELTKGGKYKVVKMSAVSTYVVNDLANQFGYYSNRFKKVEAPDTPVSTVSTNGEDEVKVGDMVECISNTTSTGSAIPGITVGKQYKVNKMIGTLGKGINITNNAGVDHNYFMDRFKKVSDTPKTRPPKSTVKEEDDDEIRVGDDVVCIKVPTATYLTLGKVYQVFAVNNEASWARIQILNDKEYLNLYNEEYFQKTTKI